MSDATSIGLCAKIARLALELGWNQQTLARQAKLHRLTVAHICGDHPQRLHNATVQACAQAFGIGPHELRTEPIERLLPKVRPPRTLAEQRRRLFEQAMQPEVRHWLEQNPERAAALVADELDELMSLQGVGGPLTAFGVAESLSESSGGGGLCRKSSPSPGLNTSTCSNRSSICCSKRCNLIETASSSGAAKEAALGDQRKCLHEGNLRLTKCPANESRRVDGKASFFSCGRLSIAQPAFNSH